ncbi:MarR family winged helix-turn-helix transcriptional regulator [Microbacterium sp. Se5.02b]|uniref:MarR family winged helix-turn-helix transcriptional regulator n=1 Tax=Microbacterium sp. Se5.02b TaxID=2864103 RepID=UPI00215DC433|nr:MarR family transcriptional regulator [Microbacterium sp. Se5.02b]
MSDAQIDVLRALPHGTSRGPAEIAAQLRLSRPTVSNLLGAMETDGLVERGPDPSDGRRVAVRASARARELFDRFDAVNTALVTRVSRELDDADRAALDAALPALERLCAVLTDPDAAPSTTHEDVP